MLYFEALTLDYYFLIVFLSFSNSCISITENCTLKRMFILLLWHFCDKKIKDHFNSRDYNHELIMSAFVRKKEKVCSYVENQSASSKYG